jgi:hypothetical protein
MNTSQYKSSDLISQCEGRQEQVKKKTHALLCTKVFVATQENKCDVLLAHDSEILFD